MLFPECPLPGCPWLLSPDHLNGAAEFSSTFLHCFLFGAGIFRMKLYANRQPWNGWPGLLRPIARSPSCHLVVTGTRQLLIPCSLFKWYAGSGGGGAGELRAGGQQPLGELLTVYTIVYSLWLKVLQPSSAVSTSLVTLSPVPWIHSLINNFFRSDSRGHWTPSFSFLGIC